jgi:hypothetical protein
MFVFQAAAVLLLLLLLTMTCRCEGVIDRCRSRFGQLNNVISVCSGSATTNTTACGCAVIPDWRQRQCQRDAKLLNALSLAACANKLPPTFNVNSLKASDSGCNTVLSSSGRAVLPDELLADLMEECANVTSQGGCSGFSRGPDSLSARCSLAGQCAARIVDALSCTGDNCWLDVVRYRCAREWRDTQQYT